MLPAMQRVAKWCWDGDAEDRALRGLFPPADFGTFSPISALLETETKARFPSSLSRMAPSFPSHPPGGSEPILELIDLLAALPLETRLEVAMSSMKF